MKKHKLFLLLLPVLLTGCTANYTLTYKDNNFSEEVIIDNISDDEEAYFDRFELDDSGETLKINDTSDKKYTYTNNGISKIISFNYGEKLEITKLLKYCYDDVIIIDGEDYINITTTGDKLCKDYDLKINFETDKKVLSSNADEENNNIYTWTDLSKNINLTVSKTKEPVSTKSSKDNVIIRLIIAVLMVVGIIVFFTYNKKKIKKVN